MVTISFISYQENKWWAFKQMGILPPQLKKINDIAFSKVLGTGSGFGFSLKPDFSTYALLIKWKSIAARDNFLNSSNIIKEIQSKSNSITTYILEELGAHGKWHGLNPFEKEANYNSKQIGVLTRARINFARLPRFWQNVPKASKAIQQAKGLKFTKGIGEWPLIEQATFSIWESMDYMKDYAYSSIHREIIQQVKKQSWYKEELFARFNIIDKIEH